MIKNKRKFAAVLSVLVISGVSLVLFQNFTTTAHPAKVLTRSLNSIWQDGRRVPVHQVTSIPTNKPAGAFTGYRIEASLGYVLDYPENYKGYSGLVPLYECVDAITGHTFVVKNPECLNIDGVRNELLRKFLGFIWKDNAPGRRALYSCSDQYLSVGMDYFVSYAPNCEGRQTIELLGYADQNTEAPYRCDDAHDRAYTSTIYNKTCVCNAASSKWLFAGTSQECRW